MLNNVINPGKFIRDKISEYRASRGNSPGRERHPGQQEEMKLDTL